MSSNSNNDNANIQSAVTFLRDPSVQSSTLARKVAFLEAKGLSSSDIDTAIRIASSSSPSAPTNAGQQLRYAGQGFQAYPDYRQQQQWERLGPTWKDWFIVATIGGAAGTLLYSLARVRPPSHSLAWPTPLTLHFVCADRNTSSLHFLHQAVANSRQSKTPSLRNTTKQPPF